METRKFIPQHKPTFESEERQALIEYISTDNPFYTEFKKTKQLEEMIANYTKSKHCIMMPNGTLSLSCALIALGVKAGDEVICPVLTMAASATSIQLIGAKPVFCKTKQLTLDINDVKSKITNKTKAIMFVSLNNHCSSLEEIVLFCQESGIPLLEDSAQSLGCWYNEKHVGTFGKIGSFSFSTPKIISTGQGGALITDDDDLAKQIRLIKNFGRSISGTTDCYETFGVNLKITDFQAVVGIEQMKKLDNRINKMTHIYETYRTYLGEYMIDKPYDGYIPWFVCIYVDDPISLSKELKDLGIGARLFYPVLTTQGAFSSDVKCEESEKISTRGLWLPSYITLIDSEIDYVCKTILSCLKN
jgi:perosamine synthetase